MGVEGRGVWQVGAGQKVSVDSVSPVSLQPGLQRLAGLVELVDAIYEDLQSCYSIYASLFHRWHPGLLRTPTPSPPRAATGARAG